MIGTSGPSFGMNAATPCGALPLRIDYLKIKNGNLLVCIREALIRGTLVKIHFSRHVFFAVKEL
jgi:hypothetical protein